MRMNERTGVVTIGAITVLGFFVLLTYNSHMNREAYIQCITKYSADTCVNVIR